MKLKLYAEHDYYDRDNRTIHSIVEGPIHKVSYEFFKELTIDGCKGFVIEENEPGGRSFFLVIEQD